MIVDSSALLAVLLREPDSERYETAIATAAGCRMAAVNLLETSMVVESRGGAAAGHELDVFLERAGIEPAPITTEQVQVARIAWRRFGKGNHPARLNLGRLLRLRAREVGRGAAPVQGRRLLPYRHRGGVMARAGVQGTPGDCSAGHGLHCADAQPRCVRVRIPSPPLGRPTNLHG